MGSLKKLAGQTALYGLSSIVGRALNFLLVPFYTSVLTVSDFGVMTDVYVYMAFLNIIYLFGMETTYFRFANEHDEPTAFNHAFSWIFIIGGTLSTIFILFSQNIASLLSYPQHSDFIVFIALILIIDSISAIPFARLRHQGNAKLFAFAKLTNIGVNIGLNLFFLIICRDVQVGKYASFLSNFVKSFYDPDFKVGYILLSNLIANGLFIIILIKSIFSYRPQVSWKFIKPMFQYAYPLMFLGLAGMVNEMIDRLLLKEMFPKHLYPNKTNLEVLGIYGGIYKLSIFITLVRQAFQYAAEPFFFSKAKDRNAPETFATVMKYYVLFCCTMFLGISLFREFIGGILLRQADFQEGLYILPFLLLANIFLGIYYNQSVWYKLTNKTYFGTIISFIGAGITLLLNTLLIPIWGYFGCAVTTLVCYFSMSFISYFLGNKHYPINYPIKSIFAYILGSSFLILVSFYQPFQIEPLMAFFINFLLFIVFVSFVIFQEKEFFFKKR